MNHRAIIEEPFSPEPASWSDWLARGALLLYAFALPFGHNAAAKNIALAGMLVALVPALRARRLHLDARSPVLLAVVAVMGCALLSSLVGIEVAGNLDAYRKHFLPLILTVPLTIAHFRTRRAWLVLFGVMAAGFGLRTGLALHEMLTTTREQGLFFKGFAIDSALFAPLLAGLAVATRGRWRLGWALTLALVGVAVIVDGSRTAAAAVALGCLAIPLLLGRWRATLVLIVVGGLLGAGLMLARPDIAARYEAALQASAYTGPTGMSIRYPIWIGVWQVAQPRPLLGHGFGWKKLGRTTVREGFLDRWKAANDPYLAYTVFWFSLPTDKVNPHSLVMELLFEVGFVGLAVYAFMLAVLLWQAFRLARAAPIEWRPLPATAFALLTSYLIINVANGLWIGTGSSVFVVACLEFCRRLQTAEA